MPVPIRRVADLVLACVLARVHAILQTLGVERDSLRYLDLATLAITLGVAANNALVSSLLANNRDRAVHPTKSRVAHTSAITAHPVLQIRTAVHTQRRAAVIPFETWITHTPEPTGISGRVHAWSSAVCRVANLDGLTLVTHTMPIAVIGAATALAGLALPTRLAQAFACQAEPITVAIIRAAFVRAV